MPKLFKKKKKSNQKVSKIYMPYKKNSDFVKRKSKKFSLKKKGNSRYNRRGKKVNILHLFVYIISPLLLISLLYISVVSVVRIRSRGVDDDIELQYVIGIEDVPTYPKSAFIFTNSINELSVANFISSGNSAYRIPLNKNIVDVYSYYEEILPEYGWEYILSVEVGSEEMKSGQYWIKGERGLRIYSKFNDVWYELITPVQAYVGLRDRVEREIERDLLLTSEEPQDLLPDFEWLLDVPREYVISYGTSDYDNLRVVEFRRLGSDEKVTVIPIGKMGQVLDNYLSEYVDILNQRDEENNWTITNTILTYTNFGRALKGTISSGSVVHDISVVPNTYNSVIYIIEANRLEDPFFDFVFTNLTPQGIDLGDND